MFQIEILWLSTTSSFYTIFYTPQNLYAVSELAQHKIRSRAIRNNWATNAYPGKVNLPSDIFKALPSTEIQTKVFGVLMQRYWTSVD